MNLLRRTPLLAVLATSASVVAAAPAIAAEVTYHVNTTADTIDALPGDGVCADANGHCSLRAAMMEAERQPAQTTAVLLPAGRFTLTRPPVLGEGDMSANGAFYNLGDLTVQGAGARDTIIDANHLDRAFFNFGAAQVGVAGADVTGRAHLTLNDLQITNGAMSSTSVATQPGPVGGGAIGNTAWLTLRRVTLDHNHGVVGGALMDGQLGRTGQVSFPDSYLEMYDSTVSDNVADWEGGGMRIDGPGLIVNSTITGNVVRSSCCSQSTSDGSVDGEGGGIDARGEGQVDIVNSTIVRNHAVIGGGGVNIANGYEANTGAGTPAGLPGPMSLRNTIVAANSSDRGAANCKETGANLISRGHNIASDGSCFLTASGDKPSTDPLLSPFGDHGGPTDTLLPLPGSPAIDAATNCPDHDQRGVPRSSPCDIGSVEQP